MRSMPGIIATIGSILLTGGEGLQVRFDGDGTAFAAECVVLRDGAEQAMSLNGVAPADYRLDATGMRCQITVTSEGSLDVTVQRGGDVTRSRTAGKGSTVSLNLR